MFLLYGYLPRRRDLHHPLLAGRRYDIYPRCFVRDPGGAPVRLNDSIWIGTEKCHIKKCDVRRRASRRGRIRRALLMLLLVRRVPPRVSRGQDATKLIECVAPLKAKDAHALHCAHASILGIGDVKDAVKESIPRCPTLVSEECVSVPTPRVKMQSVSDIKGGALTQTKLVHAHPIALRLPKRKREFVRKRGDKELSAHAVVRQHHKNTDNAKQRERNEEFSQRKSSASRSNRIPA